MKATFRRILVGTGVGIVLLGLGVLEMLTERLPIDQSSAANPSNEPARWRAVVDPRGHLLSLKLGSGRGGTTHSPEAQDR